MSKLNCLALFFMLCILISASEVADVDIDDLDVSGQS